MEQIFVSSYNTGSYDSCHEVNLRAHASEEEALAFNVKHKAAYEHSVRNAPALIEFVRQWHEANPIPRGRLQDARSIKMPQWPGKKGSKKAAPSEVRAAFEAREKATYDEFARAQAANAAMVQEHYSICLAALKGKMAELGCTQEEIDAQRDLYTPYHDDREYTVETIPFGPEA